MSNLELASRLSFFLWSSIPDEPLLNLAEKGRLSDPAILEQQVRRMLADPRATDSLVSDFDRPVAQSAARAGSGRRSALLSEFRREPGCRPSKQENRDVLVASTLREDQSVDGTGQRQLVPS